MGGEKTVDSYEGHDFSQGMRKEAMPYDLRLISVEVL